MNKINFIYYQYKNLSFYTALCTAFVFIQLTMPMKTKANNGARQTTIENVALNFIKHRADTGINGNIIVAGEKPVLISNQYSFTEGPALDKNGNVYFTDQPNDRIWKYSTNGTVTLFMEKTGRSNGMYFDKKGNLISCADEQNQLWKIDPEKKTTVILNDFKGQSFNGPNDLWINPVNNDIYFTDPYYKRNYWKEDHAPRREPWVYHLPNNQKEAIPVDTSLIQPNGIIGSPDGKFLYVADIEGDKTYRYSINKDGSLSDKQLFVSQGSDGMTIDKKGNIYLTGKGVTVYNRQGQKIEHIDVPEEWTANVCFGGKKKNLLFITASKSIYILKMKVKGVQ